MTRKHAVLLVLGILLSVALVFAAEPAKTGKGTAAKPDCAAMMQQHQQMMDKMQTMDKKVNDLKAKMDAAPADQKVPAMAALLDEMVAQRTEMSAMMMHMQPMMMSHMMEHMKAGTMSDCPMMKDMMKEGGTMTGHEHGTTGGTD